MRRVRRLWAGDLPLDEAFWTWAVLIGVSLNLITSVLFLALIAADQPVLALLAGYAVPVPYNLLVLVGVWRSAAREPGRPARAELIRVVTLIGVIVLTLT